MVNRIGASHVLDENGEKVVSETVAAVLPTISQKEKEAGVDDLAEVNTDSRGSESVEVSDFLKLSTARSVLLVAALSSAGLLTVCSLVRDIPAELLTIIGSECTINPHYAPLLG